MNAIDKFKLLVHVARWRLTWNKRDIDYLPPKSPGGKFITARQAAALIESGRTIFSCGMAGHARCSIFYWAIRERFERSGQPNGLTWIGVGAQGGRGRAPGTIEEIAFPGLITRYIVGHAETSKAQLRLADEGHLDLHTMPQGVMSFLARGQGEGEQELVTEIGVNSFLDPRVGTGTAVTPHTREQFVEVREGKLAYRLPKIDVAMFSAPYADAEGNIYFTNASSITENVECAHAAHRNGGLVLAAVSAIVEKDESRIGIPAERVSHVVVNPRNEQTGSVPQHRFWPMFTVGSTEDTAESVAKLKFINTVLKITPVRGPVENALARMAAALFTTESRPGAIVNIGVGLPEEVSRLLYESGLYKDLTFTSETGVYGGLPTPGIFFGGSINPERIEPSSWIFKLYEKDLETAVLGFLQVDSEGNVNVSKRGSRMLDYVGPGGFPNIVHGARSIIFVGSWMAKARMSVANGKLRIETPGKHKFIEKVDEVTFSAKEALAAGKRVFYVTNVGVFRLTERGLELIRVMPGVDPKRDIVDACPARVYLPETGMPETVPENVVTGENFRLGWKS